jgi:PPOX class probable F420-dependent enzyme
VDAGWVDEVLSQARVGRLGTIAGDGTVRLVPICFVVVDGWLASAVDHKPKRTAQLRRLDDIEAIGSATVLVDHYDEDWTNLWWVRVSGRALVHRQPDDVTVAVRAALIGKYPQYRDRPPTGAVYRVAMDQIGWWRASDVR